MEQTQKFEKLKKKYALNNSYFKNRPHNAPSTPFEIFEYLKEHNELPYENGKDISNWMYECFVEYQKKSGVFRSQFFTPQATAIRIAAIADDYFDKQPYVLDACCGFGMLSKALRSKGFIVHGFDIEGQFSNLYGYFTECLFEQNDFRDYQSQYSSIVSNPPYEVKECSQFLEQLYGWLIEKGTAVLLLPKGFVDKDKPKQLIQTLSKFTILHREDMTEDFERTKVRAEIVVLQK